MSTDKQAFTLETLTGLSEQLQQARQNAASADEAMPPQVMNVMLAAFVAYHLHKGGFAQLLFNAQGAYLAQIAQMLQNINARNTLHFYESAVRICLNDKSGYQDFLAGDFVSPGAFKNALHEVSLDYFASAPHFMDEAQPLLMEICSVARDWLA